MKYRGSVFNFPKKTSHVLSTSEVRDAADEIFLKLPPPNPATRSNAGGWDAQNPMGMFDGENSGYHWIVPIFDGDRYSNILKIRYDYNIFD